MYIVEGGKYKDTTFSSIKGEDYVKFGPFKTQKEAYDCWKEHSWLNVDNALYRLRIRSWSTRYDK